MVRRLPTAIGQAECGGVNWLARKGVAAGDVGVQPSGQALVEALGPVGVGHGSVITPSFRSPVLLLMPVLVILTSAGWCLSAAASLARLPTAPVEPLVITLAGTPGALAQPPGSGQAFQR